MRKVRYVHIGVCYSGLTVNKVYDIIEYYKGSSPLWDEIKVIDDYGFFCWCSFLGVKNKPLFIDVTQEYRSEVIDSILE